MPLSNFCEVTDEEKKFYSNLQRHQILNEMNFIKKKTFILQRKNEERD
jgi:hypothetical protein